MNVTPAESSLSLIVIEGWTIALKKKLLQKCDSVHRVTLFSGQTEGCRVKDATQR